MPSLITDEFAEFFTFADNFPFWRPDPSNQGLYRISSEKAFQAGWPAWTGARPSFIDALLLPT